VHIAVANDDGKYEAANEFDYGVFADFRRR